MLGGTPGGGGRGVCGRAPFHDIFAMTHACQLPVKRYTPVRSKNPPWNPARGRKTRGAGPGCVGRALCHAVSPGTSPRPSPPTYTRVWRQNFPSGTESRLSKRTSCRRIAQKRFATLNRAVPRCNDRLQEFWLLPSWLNSPENSNVQWAIGGPLDPGSIPSRPRVDLALSDHIELNHLPGNTCKLRKS
eukprot:gene7877-biopygen12096